MNVGEQCRLQQSLPNLLQNRRRQTIHLRHFLRRHQDLRLRTLDYWNNRMIH